MKFSRVGLLIFVVVVLAIGAELKMAAPPSAFAQSNSGERSAGESAREKAQVTGLKLLTLKDQTRVMLDLSHETRFEVRRLKENPLKSTPARIYIDILGAKLALTSRDTLTVDDGVLRQVRVGQYSADVVRVVLDMNALRAHNAFIIPEPTQLVIDILGQGGQQRSSGEGCRDTSRAGQSKARSRGKKGGSSRRPSVSAKSSWIPVTVVKIQAPSASAVSRKKTSS